MLLPCTLVHLHVMSAYPFFDVAAVVAAKYGLALSAAALAYALWRRRPWRLLPAFAIGAIAATALDLLAGKLIFHERPFVALHEAPLLAHAADNGFPSDHSAVAAYVAATLLFIDTPAGLVAIAAALLVGFGRIYSLVHSPVDVLGGWIIGAVPALAVGWVALRSRTRV